MPLPLRTDFSASELRSLARRVKNVAQSRRLLSLAAVLEGANRGEAARIGGMDRQTLRDWVIRFNESGPDGLLDHRKSGRKSRLSADQLTELSQIVETGPDPVVHKVVRWRRIDLQKEILDRFGVQLSERGIGAILHRLGFSRISARPHHPAQDGAVIAEYKKTSPGR